MGSGAHGKTLYFYVFWASLRPLWRLGLASRAAHRFLDVLFELSPSLCILSLILKVESAILKLKAAVLHNPSQIPLQMGVSTSPILRKIMRVLLCGAAVALRRALGHCKGHPKGSQQALWGAYRGFRDPLVGCLGGLTGRPEPSGPSWGVWGWGYAVCWSLLGSLGVFPDCSCAVLALQALGPWWCIRGSSSYLRLLKPFFGLPWLQDCCPSWLSGTTPGVPVVFLGPS